MQASSPSGVKGSDTSMVQQVKVAAQERCYVE